MAVSSKTSVITPIQGSSSQKWLFEPPALFNWAEMNVNFSPQFGQQIRMREKFELTVMRDDSASFYYNENRYLPEINIGYWQHLTKRLDQSYYVENSGQAMAAVVPPETNIFVQTTFAEWDYHIYRAFEDFLGAVISTVDACNADLEPAAVPNGFINSNNVLAYAEIVQSFYSGQFISVLSQLNALVDPTTAGYRFPDKKALFTALTQQLVVDLTTLPLFPTIGSLGVCLHPGWSILSCEHTIECIDYTKIQPLANQIEPAVCTYLPGFAYTFDENPPLTCVELLAQQVALNNWFYTEADAIAFSQIPGNGGGNPVQSPFPCPGGSSLPGLAWILQFV